MNTRRMETILLKAELRDVKKGSVKEKRAEGFIPAVVYGRGVDSRSLWISSLDFSKMYHVAGESTVVQLQVNGDKNVNVLIHDTQTDPVSGKFTHADLLQIRMDEAIETHIPLEFVGEAPAVKTLGGMLIKSAEEVLVSCLPKDLPHAIEIDISSLEGFDDHISMGDIVLPKGVTLLSEATTAVASIGHLRTEAELEDLDAKVEGDVTKIEGVEKEEAAKTEA